jgi:hypothetical protein
MKRLASVALTAAALFVFPTAATAGWTVVFDVSELHMRVGETAIVPVHVEWRSGFSYFPFPASTFYSSDEAVALVNGSYPDAKAVFIDARAPGFAEVRRAGDRWAVNSDGQLTIDVVCGPSRPVRLEQQVLRTKVGEPVTLTAFADIPWITQVAWFEGRTGDRSKPLALSSSQIAYTPTTPGQHYVWASAVNACSDSTAEALIEAVTPRRRAVR